MEKTLDIRTSADPVTDPPPTNATDEVLTTARIKLVDSTVLISSIFSVFSMAFSLVRSIDTGWQPIYFVHIGLFMIMTWIYLFRKNLDVHLKITITTAVFIFTGLAGFIQLGLASGGIIFVVVGCVLAVVFHRTRTALVYVSFTLVVLFILASLHVNGKLATMSSLDDYNSNWTSWLNLLVRFTVFAFIIVFAVSKLFNLYVGLFQAERSKSMELMVSRKELQQVLASLEESERNYRLLFQSGNDSVIVHDEKSGTITNINDTACSRLGYARDELLGMNLEELMESCKTPVPDTPADVDEEGDHVLYKSFLHSKDGTTVPVEINAHHFPINGVTHTMSIARDITERVKSEERLHRSLKEKETLLAEIHHRVKNNLQVISSLLDMQTYYIKDKEVIKHLRNTASRVEAMGLLHKKLYESDSLGRIEMKDYVESLVNKILYTNRLTDRGIQFILSVDTLFFNIDTALPCGLLINEIVTNSLKYAFPDGRPGTIGVILDKGESDTYLMTVYDDGSGLPENVDFFANSSLGMQLIYMLTKQLGGEITISRSGGTKYEMRFRQVVKEEKRWQ